MYFETGREAQLSADAHHGVDQLTLEGRTYGVSRAFDPFLVNTVVGFIGPKYSCRWPTKCAPRTGAGGSLHGEAPRVTHGLRRLLHQPCECPIRTRTTICWFF